MSKNIYADKKSSSVPPPRAPFGVRLASENKNLGEGDFRRIAVAVFSGGTVMMSKFFPTPPKVIDVLVNPIIAVNLCDVIRAEADVRYVLDSDILNIIVQELGTEFRSTCRAIYNR